MRTQRPRRSAALVVSAALLASGLAAATAGTATASVMSSATCSAGAHTLSPPGAVVYPDTGNGGYTSVHTDVTLRYDEPTDLFLPGTHVVLTDMATQCLTSFSLDLERNEHGQIGSSDLQVRDVLVNGVQATFAFEQPTYPGDPNGQEDPDPRAHEVSQQNPVGGPDDNPLPPACSPELKSGDSGAIHNQDGRQCPANKLVVTPATNIQDGDTFTVQVDYTGRPGIHHDGDGSTEGWFRVPGGTAMSTEPVASEDWMPLNDYPTAKPTYDFTVTTNAGKTAICNGTLTGKQEHGATRQFPNGSTTFHWSQPSPVPSYLVLTMVGDYPLSSHVAADGIRYYRSQDANIPVHLQHRNAGIMAQQPHITDFESQFNGPFPFASDGVVASAVSHGAAVEEMETMIVFTNGYVNKSTLYHENMHQWWGDNVTEGGYDMTFFKEGMATLGQLFAAAEHQQSFGGELIHWFDAVYGSGDTFWTEAPSDPAPYDLFSGSATYDRPAAAYVALWEILGRGRFIQALHTMQTTYGGSSITEPQLEQGFAQYLPEQTQPCLQRLDDFFTQWFDTAYPSGGGDNRPQITGPGLAGGGFYGGSCPPPTA